MQSLLIILWFIWELKYILFWLYLWQLKEYHVGRFLDHFNTHKGKKLIASLEQCIKLSLLIFLFVAREFTPFLITILLLVYAVEAVLFARSVFYRTAKKPILTFKTIVLIISCLVLLVEFFGLIANWQDLAVAKALLLWDLFTPVIISLVVLLWQPLAVFTINRKLKKARSKLEKIKNLSGLKVIAITGSYGKTSTKEFLTTILSQKFNVLSTKDHQNSEIGVANSILNDLKPSHKIFIAEVGAYNKGKVKQVCKMLKPDLGIVTGVNGQHLSLFGSMDNLLSAEGGGELANALKDKGILFVNGENKHCVDLYRTFSGQKKIYALDNKIVDANIWANEISMQKDSISFLALEKGENTNHIVHFNVKVLGRQNVQNLLGAIIVARQLGMSLEEISQSAKNIKPQQAGMVVLEGKHGLQIIDSSYSSNPDGAKADLDYLSVFSGKKVVVMPCLIELGKKSAEAHKEIGKKIGQICNLAIITTKDKFVELKNGAMEAGMKEKDILLCDKPEEINSIITVFCKSGDAVLLEGRVPKSLINLLTK